MTEKSRNYTNEIIKLTNQIYRAFYTFSHDNGAQNRILHFLMSADMEHGVYQKDIQEELNIRAATVSALLKKMEKQGLIVREMAVGDERKKRIYLTETAIRKKEALYHDFGEMEEKLVSGISKKDLCTFENVMKKMINNIS